MDVVKYFGNIEVPTDNNEHIRKFLELNEARIKENVLKMWNEFEKTSVQKDEVIPEVNSAVNDNLDENKTFPDSPIASEPNQIDEIIATDLNIQKTDEKILDPVTENKLNETFSLQVKSKTIVLPNGKVNQDYKFLFRIEELGLGEIAGYWFDGLEIIGLSFNSNTYELIGIPLIPGDHKVKLKIKRSDWSEGKPVFEREITLIINPDPKTLWKNIPTPTDIGYFKPDCAKSFVKVVAGTGMLGFGKNVKKDMVAASQRGRSHAQEGKPRDDDFSLSYLKEVDWYIMAVADGAGSAKLSRKGSEIACKTVIEVCESLIKGKHKEFEHLIKEFSSDKTGEKRKKMGDSLYGILGNAVFKSVKNIEEEAKLSNKPVKDFSTTLIVSICKKFKFGWFVGAFWVGDGGIGIYNKETKFLKVLGESDGGEYAGQTRFLTMPEITQPTELYRRLRFDIVDDFTALVLMTDGITDPKFETDANLLKIEKWDELWTDLSKEVDFSDNNEAAADQLLSWLDFWSPGNHDDRTIAILF